MCYPYKGSSGLIGRSVNTRTWPKLVPVSMLYCHESQFEAINIIQFNAKPEIACTRCQHDLKTVKNMTVAKF